ncbi:MAG: hypothetical protein GY711_01945 [bacterium]|nr:hypothetical protein [bacterium]
MKQLTVRVRDDQGRLFDGSLESTWHEAEEVRLAIVFAPNPGPVLPLGMWVLLSFSGGPLEMPIEVEGEVTFRHQDDRTHGYHFRFADRARRRLGPLVEPRQAMRVPPAKGAPVEVALLRGPNELPLVGALKDLSVTGGSVILLESFESTLFLIDRLELELRLPGEFGAVRIVGLVRNRGLVGGSLVYGFSIASDGPTLPQIVAYVEDRLKAISLSRRAKEGVGA